METVREPVIYQLRIALEGISPLNSSNGSLTAVNFGVSSDLPVPAYFDGDGKTDVAVFRDGNWYQ